VQVDQVRQATVSHTLKRNVALHQLKSMCRQEALRSTSFHDCNSCAWVAVPIKNRKVRQSSESELRTRNRVVPSPSRTKCRLPAELPDSERLGRPASSITCALIG
jgi:hypothetical protein